MVRAAGPELILGKIFDSIGFNQFCEELFRKVVFARLVYPASKLRTAEYLLQYRRKHVDVAQISKTDLRIRSVRHRRRARTESHVCVAFVAYTIYKELERLLVQLNSSVIFPLFGEPSF